MLPKIQVSNCDYAHSCVIIIRHRDVQHRIQLLRRHLSATPAEERRARRDNLAVLQLLRVPERVQLPIKLYFLLDRNNSDEHVLQLQL